MLENIGVEMSVRMESGCGDLSGGGTPVADNFTVQKDDRPEDAPVVMGLVAMVRVKDYLAAFVADQVFVVGRKKVHAAAAKTAGAGVAVQDEVETFPMLMNQFISEQRNT